MSAFEIVGLKPPLDIASKVLSYGGVRIELRDSQGHEVAYRFTEASRVDSSYAELAGLRDALGEGWRVLGERLTKPADSRAALSPSWSFDGCQPKRSYEEQSLAGPIGCYVAVVFVLFFVLPTLAAVLLGLGVVAGLLWFVAWLLNAVGSTFEAARDEKSAHVRVLTINEKEGTQLEADSGLAHISPPFLSNDFSPKVVCYGRVADRVVLAAAEANPSKAARIVADETLRQRRDLADRMTRADGELTAARNAATRIANAEARAKKSLES